MNPYVVERLIRQRQAELLREAQELREAQGLAPRRGALLARLGAWARRLVTGGGREPLGRRRGRQEQRQRA